MSQSELPLLDCVDMKTGAPVRMGMLPAWEGKRQKDKTAKNHPYNSNTTRFIANFLEVLVPPPCLGLILLDLQAVQSCYCSLLLLIVPHSLSTRLTQLWVLLKADRGSRISPRKIFRMLLQFLWVAFHSMDLSETLDLQLVFYPCAST